MNEHEEKPIEAFIVREKRQGYKSLLGNPKKRRAILDCLNHCHDLDERYVTWLPSNAAVEQLLRQEGSPDEVYVISDTKSVDGKTLPLDEAIFQSSAGNWGTIISCIPGQLAYYYDEAGDGQALLKRKLGT
jgi:hypothetical protein